MAITNKTEFIQYCLRRLGAPSINIEVTDAQIGDAYDDALKMLQDFHMNGYERQYLKHQLTQENIDNGYIPIPDAIIGVSKLFSLINPTTGNYIFDLNYQLHLNDLWDTGGGSGLAYYANIKQYTNMLDQMLNGQPLFRFNRVQNRLYFDIAKSKVSVGQWMLVECMKALTPEDFPELWAEPWFKKYTTALIKRTWGAQLKKFNNIVTVGNVSIDGQNIYNEAIQEIADLEIDLRAIYEEPVGFILG